MDIYTITDIDKLKAMAYDQLVAKQQAVLNLQLIEQRITELQKKDAQSGEEIKE